MLFTMRLITALLITTAPAAPLGAQRPLNVIVFAEGYHYGPAGHELVGSLNDSTASSCCQGGFRQYGKYPGPRLSGPL